MQLKNLFFLLTSMAFVSCAAIRKTPKSNFTNGFYTRTNNSNKQKVYIDINEDSLVIHPTIKTNNEILVDQTQQIEIYPTEINAINNNITVFSVNSFDIDFLTMPLKFRPTQKGVPSQLNTTLNGSVYFGYRTDKYMISYAKNPFSKSDRIINHYGFSIGLFGGLGNTAMNPTNTNSIISSEYDGIIFTKGIAGIIAVNNFTVGLSFGLDHLIDKNHQYWIYQAKPWFGLAFGLNLN